MENNFSLDSVLARERSILKNVYIWMTLGLGLTGIVALGFASSPSLIRGLVSNPILFFGLIIAEFGLVLFLSARLHVMSVSAATIGFTAYAALNGVTMSIIFLAYTGTSIAATFFITAGTFAGMSVYALTTKRNLSSFSTYLVMGLWGIIIASLVNMFLKSSGLDYLISFVGVVVFLGLTAYDTQTIKGWNEEAGYNSDEAVFVRISIMGALKLYLDFINLFLMMLRFFGSKRE